MSWKTKKECEKDARKWLKHMTGGRRGSNWTMEVWENLGWHFKLRCGGLKLYAHRHADGVIRWSVLLNDDNDSGNMLFHGEPEKCFDPKEDPKEIVRKYTMYAIPRILDEQARHAHMMQSCMEAIR